MQESFLQQEMDSTARGEITLDFVLGNEPGQLADISVGEHFGKNDHNSYNIEQNST